MNKAPAACGNRPPLKDTSKHFVNTPTSKTLAAASMSVKKAPKNQDTHNFQSNDASIVHAQKLNTSDRTPFLMGTSTPKKDGFLPSLTSRNLNNSNIIIASTTKSVTSNVTATNTASTKVENNAESIVAVGNDGTANGGTAAVNNNTVYKKMTGNELSRWQQTWREILPKSYVYFEQDESNERDKKKAMIALKRLGATVEPFFCENVTIIISRRPYNKSVQYPKGDIFRYAVKKQLKVWNVEKVFRFLNHLGEQTPDIDEFDASTTTGGINNNNTHTTQQALSTNNNNNLSNLLMNERIFGPSDRDPSVKRNDFKYFTELYLYIWDVTHKTRPVAIREWKDKTSYPKIHHTTNGKSLFVPETRSQNSISVLKRHQRRLQCLSDTFSYRQNIIECSYKLDSPNHEIRHPSYEERVAFKRRWEETTYKFNPEENPNVKYQKLYDSLNEKDKVQFEEMFPVNDDIDVSLVDLSSSNKRQKVCAVKEIGELECQSNSSNSKYHKEEALLIDSRGDKNPNDVDLTSKLMRDKNKCDDTVQAGQKIKHDGLINDVINGGIGDGDHDEGDNCDHNDDDDDDDNDDDADYGKNEDISKLVSDKVDIIDEINNPLINDTLLVDHADEAKKATKNNSFESVQQRATQCYLSKRTPKLMREDSIINGRSQNVSADGKLLCEYGEIAASGIQASGVNPSGTCSHGNTQGGIGNGLGPSRSQVMNKTLANEHKRIVVLTPTLNNRQKNNTAFATINPEILKNAESFSQKENRVTVLIADDTIPETQEQLLEGYKDSSNKTTINEDELAALRSVETVNPFISESISKQPKNETGKDSITPSVRRNSSKLGKLTIKESEENLASCKRQPKNNITAAIGIFKEQKFEKSKHELKPGYCENCRVKYSDFSDHVLSEKHRSFAEDDSNFKQIDSLIDLLFMP